MDIKYRVRMVAKDCGEKLFGEGLLWGEGDPFVGISSPGADIVDFINCGMVLEGNFYTYPLGGDGYWFAYDTNTSTGFPTESQDFTWEDVNSWYIDNPDCVLAYYQIEEHAIHIILDSIIPNNLKDVENLYSAELSKFYSEWEEYLAH